MKVVFTRTIHLTDDEMSTVEDALRCNFDGERDYERGRNLADQIDIATADEVAKLIPRYAVGPAITPTRNNKFSPPSAIPTVKEDEKMR